MDLIVGSYQGVISAVLAILLFRHQLLQQKPQIIVPGIYNPTKLDWLFLDHPKLWKKEPRLSMKELYTTILPLGRERKSMSSLSVRPPVFSFHSHI
jgi:E3 ubiquitin-protein ligase UBR1